MSKEVELKDETANGTKPVLGEVYVFELKDGKMKQISIGLESIEDANGFIETMKEGMYYKDIRPDCVLIAMEVLNFA
jgi:hypothetical protein